MNELFYAVMFLHTKTNTNCKIILIQEVDNIEFCKLQNYGIQENGFWRLFYVCQHLMQLFSDVKIKPKFFIFINPPSSLPTPESSI